MKLVPVKSAAQAAAAVVVDAAITAAAADAANVVAAVVVAAAADINAASFYRDTQTRSFSKLLAASIAARSFWFSKPNCRKNPKLEIQNPKQIQMQKGSNVTNRAFTKFGSF